MGSWELIDIYDRVMGDDNNPRIVVEKTMGIGKLYKVSQTKGMDYVVNHYHILSLYFDNSNLTKDEEYTIKKRIEKSIYPNPTFSLPFSF